MTRLTKEGASACLAKSSPFLKSGSPEDLMEANVPELHSPFLKVSRDSISFRVINYEAILLCDGVEGLNGSVHVL